MKTTNNQQGVSTKSRLTNFAFVMLCLLLITGCETQETILKDSSLSAKDMKISSKKLGDLLSYDIFKNALKQISKTKNNSSLQNKTSIENEFGFSIVSDSVKVVEVDDYTFYTMFIEKEGSSIKDVDNFILKIKDNGEIDAYLSKYKEILLENKPFENIEKELELIYSNKYIVSDENGEHCIKFYIVMCFNNIGVGYYSHDHPATSACELEEYFYLLQDKICFPNGSNSSNNTNSNTGINTPNNSSNPHGGGGVGGFDSDGVVLTPVVQPHYNVTANILELSPAQISYINNTTQQPLLNSINTYLIHNGVNTFEEPIDEDIKLFCQEAVNHAMNNPGVFNSINPFIIEKQIDDSQLDNCTKAILNKLKQNHAIAKVIARFENPKSSYVLNFSQVPNLVNPNTLQPDFGLFEPTNQDFVYSIKLNSNNFNDSGATNLGKAKVIIHEIFHALIASILQYQGTNTPGTTMQDFPEIWNAYVNIKTGSTTPADHTFMGNHYVDVIASALQEYATGIIVPDGVQADGIYRDLAWSGLVVPFSPNSPFPNLTNSDLLRISIRQKVEMENSPFSSVNPSNNPPCLN